jgi:hypothetical protein
MALTPEEIDALKNDLSSFMLLGHLSNFIVFPVPNVDFFNTENLPSGDFDENYRNFLTTSDGEELKKDIRNVINNNVVDYVRVLLNTGLFYASDIEEAESLLSTINESIDNLTETENRITSEYISRLEQGQNNVNYGPEVDVYDDGIFVDIIDSFRR